MNMSFICVLGLITLAGYTNACTCGNIIPGLSFCRSNLVIEGVVDHVEEIYGDNYFSRYPEELIYNVTVNRVFRATADYSHVRNGDTVQLHSAGSGSLCGISLDRTTPYLITATEWALTGNLDIGLCSWILRMSLVTPEQLIGINGGYDCRCHTNAYEPSCDMSLPGVSKNCLINHALCMMNDDGRCEWLYDFTRDQRRCEPIRYSWDKRSFKRSSILDILKNDLY